MSSWRFSSAKAYYKQKFRGINRQLLQRLWECLSVGGASTKTIPATMGVSIYGRGISKQLLPPLWACLSENLKLLETQGPHTCLIRVFTGDPGRNDVTSGTGKIQRVLKRNGGHSPGGFSIQKPYVLQPMQGHAHRDLNGKAHPTIKVLKNNH